MSIELPLLKEWISTYPLLETIMDLKPVVWLNPKLLPVEEAGEFAVSYADMLEAERLWQRFAPFLATEFPETRVADGIVESPLRFIPEMKNALENRYGAEIGGSLYLKCDNELPIAGSIKARGGVYEVLHHAETLAVSAGLVEQGESYGKFSSPEFKEFFSRYSIGVGSTGNLGLGIGIISAKLGFNVSVYMSADAKQWKKDLLREKGAVVVEFTDDFGEAISAGRLETMGNPDAYFVDDEKSKHLFLGYSVAAFRLKTQLDAAGVRVDREHPLFVYLPCGVGGAPGGITFGLKQVFGDAAHCFFVEPTHSPAVMIGLMTGEKEKVCVQDFGIDNMTEGDGLAVGRPSGFASSSSEKLVSGVYSLEDDELFRLLALLADSENIFIEPSAAAGLQGPAKILASNYVETHGIQEENITHIAWSTGGALVPEQDRKLFLEKGKELLKQ